MNDKKYRVLYNNEQVLVVTEDIGMTGIPENSGMFLLVDTLSNVKNMLNSINVNTQEIDIFEMSL